MASSTVRVEGLRQLLAVTDKMPKEIKKGVRDDLRKVAEPMREEAQSLFLARVSADAGKSRYGISVRKAGTVSVEQRRKGKTGNPKLKRPNFTALQWDRALGPAFDSKQDEVVDALDEALGRIYNRVWSAGI